MGHSICGCADNPNTSVPVSTGHPKKTDPCFSPTCEITPGLTGPDYRCEPRGQGETQTLLARGDGQQTLRETYRFQKHTKVLTVTHHSDTVGGCESSCMESAQIRDAHVHPFEHPAGPRHVRSTLSEPKIHPSLGMARVLSATCSMGMGASPWWGRSRGLGGGGWEEGCPPLLSRGSADLGKGQVTEILGH